MNPTHFYPCWWTYAGFTQKTTAECFFFISLGSLVLFKDSKNIGQFFWPSSLRVISMFSRGVTSLLPSATPNWKRSFYKGKGQSVPECFLVNVNKENPPNFIRILWLDLDFHPVFENCMVSMKLGVKLWIKNGRYSILYSFWYFDWLLRNGPQTLWKTVVALYTQGQK